MEKANKPLFFTIIEVVSHPIVEGVKSYEKMRNAILFKIFQNDFIWWILFKKVFKEGIIVKTHFPIAVIKAVTQKNA